MCRFHSEVLASPVLVARKQELAELQHYLELAIRGNGTTVFVSGEAGAGKTRLVNEFLKSARNQEITVLTGWCLSNAAVPYFPFFEAFNVYFSGDQNGEAMTVTKWLKGPAQADLPEKSQMFTPQAWKDQTFTAVTKTLSIISAKKPIILFIDDVHWADSASLALIHYIARVIKSERILLVATFRSEELTLDAEGRPHSLVETLRLMRREDLYTEIKVASLNYKSVIKLAKSMLHGELQQELVQRLSEESQGNPLFVVESLRMLYERNELIQENGDWRLTSDQLEIPTKIKDIILQRLSCLVRNQKKIIEVASVIGEKFDPKLLASVLNLDFSEVVATLDTISQTTSLLVYEVELYWFDHSRTRDAIYEEISPALKKVYHGKTAESLEEFYKNATLPFSELAYHFGQAGENEKSLKYALAAGQDALAKWSNAEAIKHFSYVLKVVGDDQKCIEKRTIALEGLGDALYANSLVKEATKVFLELADIAVNDVVRLRAYRKAMEAVFQYGDMPYLMELVKKTEQIYPADRLEHARVLMGKARSLQMRAMYSGTFELLRKALQVVEEEYSLWDVAWVLVGAGPQRALFAKTDFERREGLAESLRAGSLFEDLGDLRWQMEASYVAGLTFSFCLLEDEALMLLAKVIEIDEKNKFGDYLRLVYSLTTSARSFLNIGNYKKSLVYSQKALKLLEKTDSGVAHGMVYSNLTIEHALLGDFEKSEEYFDKLMKLPSEILSNVLIQVALPKAVFFAVKNQYKESDQLFEKRLESFAQNGMPTALGFVLRLKLLYAWALKKQGRIKEAEILLKERQAAFHKGQKKFEHASLQAHLLVHRQVIVGKEIEMRLDLVNVGKKPCLLERIENILHEDFEVKNLPNWCSLNGDEIDLKKKEIGPFEVITAKLTFNILKAGVFILNPQAIYVDDLGNTETSKLQSITITANPPIPEEKTLGKISSGTSDLDQLLLGGIPEHYAVVLTGSPSDEREVIIKNYLKEGRKKDEITFFVSTEAVGIETLLEDPNFYLFLCNPKPKTKVSDLPNVYKLRSKTDLTNLSISLAKAFRKIDPLKKKRICIETISNVILDYEAKATSKWISELITDLGSKGFTMLAVMDPEMHPADQSKAIINLFDGEISIIQSDDPLDCKKSILVKKLRNQDYIKNPICLTKTT